MTNKLKNIFPMVIDDNQSSFVHVHQILDNILIYHEVIHTMKNLTSHKGIMVWKSTSKRPMTAFHGTLLGIPLCVLG